MRTLAITGNITVDGSIEMLNDWFDPNKTGHRQGRPARGRAASGERGGRPARRPADVRGLPRVLAEADRRHDGHHRVPEPGAEVRRVLDLTDPRWENSAVLSGDPVEKVTKLKQEDGTDIVLTGSITLAHTMIEAGFVDEYRIFVYPTVQGRAAGSSQRLRALATKTLGREGLPERDHLPALRGGLTDQPHPSEGRGGAPSFAGPCADWAAGAGRRPRPAASRAARVARATRELPAPQDAGELDGRRATMGPRWTGHCPVREGAR